MRIVINESAREHLITDSEIRAVIGYHAMMLRRSFIRSLGIDQLIDAEYGPQRA